jgi:hypothetical protein
LTELAVQIQQIPSRPFDRVVSVRLYVILDLNRMIAEGMAAYLVNSTPRFFTTRGLSSGPLEKRCILEAVEQHQRAARKTIRQMMSQIDMNVTIVRSRR